MRWTYCEHAIPQYSDLVELAKNINYHKTKLVQSMTECDMLGAMERLETVEELYYEYFYMAKNFFGSRVA